MIRRKWTQEWQADIPEWMVVQLECAGYVVKPVPAVINAYQVSDDVKSGFIWAIRSESRELKWQTSEKFLREFIYPEGT